jgi:hypothetical protein
MSTPIWEWPRDEIKRWIIRVGEYRQRRWDHAQAIVTIAGHIVDVVRGHADRIPFTHLDQAFRALEEAYREYLAISIGPSGAVGGCVGTSGLTWVTVRVAGEVAVFARVPLDNADAARAKLQEALGFTTVLGRADALALAVREVLHNQPVPGSQEPPDAVPRLRLALAAALHAYDATPRHGAVDPPRPAPGPNDIIEARRIRVARAQAWLLEQLLCHHIRDGQGAAGVLRLAHDAGHTFGAIVAAARRLGVMRERPSREAWGGWPGRPPVLWRLPDSVVARAWRTGQWAASIGDGVVKKPEGPDNGAAGTEAQLRRIVGIVGEE